MWLSSWYASPQWLFITYLNPSRVQLGRSPSKVEGARHKCRTGFSGFGISWCRYFNSALSLELPVSSKQPKDSSRREILWQDLEVRSMERPSAYGHGPESGCWAHTDREKPSALAVSSAVWVGWMLNLLKHVYITHKLPRIVHRRQTNKHSHPLMSEWLGPCMLKGLVQHKSNVVYCV